MAKDKFSAVWVSHSSIADYLKCPRAYYLNNVYKDPQTGHKITLMQPALALGQVVHEVLEALSVLPVETRFQRSLVDSFNEAWQKVSGKQGGFGTREVELAYKERGLQMIRRVQAHPGPLARKAIKIQQDLPYYWLSEEHNIIMCGKIDWIEYLPETESVKIIDFKTGKTEEDPNSLQLPIYYLLASNTQTRPVASMGYWYLDKDDTVIDMPLPDAEQAQKQVLEIAKRIMVARKLNQFSCKEGIDGCRDCRPLEKIVRGEAEFIGTGQYDKDVYIILSRDEEESVKEVETPF